MYLSPSKTDSEASEAGYLLRFHDASTIRIMSTKIGGYGWALFFRGDVSFVAIDGHEDNASAQIPEHVRDAARAMFSEAREGKA